MTSRNSPHGTEDHEHEVQKLCQKSRCKSNNLNEVSMFILESPLKSMPTAEETKIDCFTKQSSDVSLLILKQLSVRELSQVYCSCTHFNKFSKHPQLPDIHLARIFFIRMRALPPKCDSNRFADHFGVINPTYGIAFSNRCFERARGR
jgi:hypothetical protein